MSERDEGIADDNRVTLARLWFEAREKRDRILDAGLLGEPGWSMLLYLYAHSQKPPSIRISALTRAAGVPDTTALRWLGVLENAGLVYRIPDRSDKRVTFVELTGRGKTQMDQVLERTIRFLSQAPEIAQKVNDVLEARGSN